MSKGGKMGGVFQTETSVREWVKARTEDPFWIEPTRGSTVGVPDTFVHDSGGVWIELKCGVVKSDRYVNWKPRQGQYDKFRTLKRRGSRVGALIRARDSLLVVTDPEVFRRGWEKIPLEDLIDSQDPEAWEKILKIIVSAWTPKEIPPF